MLHVFLAAALTLSTCGDFVVSLDANGDLTLGADGPKAGVRVRRKRWTGTDGGLAHGSTREHPLGQPIDQSNATAHFDIADDHGKFAEGTLCLRPGTNRTARVRAELVAREKRDPNDITFSFSCPCDGLKGWIAKDAQGNELAFPERMADDFHLFARTTKSLELANPRDGTFLRFVFDAPCSVNIQDNRRWNSDFGFRFAPIQPYHRPFSPGERYSFSFEIVHSAGIVTRLDEPVTIRAGSEWVPIDCHRDILKGSALDFSEVIPREGPAGAYGRLCAVGDHFEFAGRPGVPQRFYGVNLCYTANTPDSETGAAVIERFRRLGYNSIRLHHVENDLRWGVFTPSGFNRAQLNKFDRFVAEAIAAGFYLTTDLYVSRRITCRQVGLGGDGTLNPYAYKALVGLHEGCTEDWMRFARDFLTHINPHTGRSLAAEPALTHLVLVNEGAMNLGWPTLSNMAFVKDLWAAWLAERRRTDPSFAPGLSRANFGPAFAQNAALQQFMADCDRKAVARLAAFVRSLGCAALLSNQNACDCAAMAQARQAYDYVDTHHYVDHPRFVRGWALPSTCRNENPLRLDVVPPSDIAFVRLAGKPFAVSEWNFSGPGRYRSVGGLLMGSFAALQDWSALWRFAYAHHVGQLAAEGDLGLSYFDLARDPIQQANDRTAVLLFLRRDLEPLANKVAVDVGARACPNGLNPPSNAPDWTAARWYAQVARAIGNAPEGWRTIPLAKAKDLAPVQSPGETGVRIDRARGRFALVTPRTVGGFAPTGTVQAGVLSFDVSGGPAAVSVSSLDARPVAASHRLLLTHLTDAQAEGRVYANAAMRTLCEAGGRTLVRTGRAEIDLALDEPSRYEVWGLDTSGRRVSRLPAEVVHGHLRFAAVVSDAGKARLSYEIVRVHD